MAKHLLYLKYVLRHKWFVFWACMELRVPLWQAIIHDWHKFLPDEWRPYVNHFYGDNLLPTALVKAQRKKAFDVAWLKHQNRAPHHWQYWLRFDDAGQEIVMDMPVRFRREMLADWRGAGLAITGKANTLEWYTPRRDGIKLHPHTRAWIEKQIGYTEGGGA